jgi:hypothetical protein
LKLITEAIRKSFPKIGETDGKLPSERKIVCKLFSCFSNFTWYCLEFDGEDTLFCYVKGHENEYGYSSLNELQNTKWQGVPAVERDMHYGDHTLQEVLDGVSEAQ